VGPSRKSFIGLVLDRPAGERLLGTAAAVAAGVLGGAHILRVHDVKEMVQVAKVCDAILAAGGGHGDGLLNAEGAEEPC
jgi:dihydropteroate synthase